MLTSSILFNVNVVVNKKDSRDTTLVFSSPSMTVYSRIDKTTGRDLSKGRAAAGTPSQRNSIILPKSPRGAVQKKTNLVHNVIDRRIVC